MWRSALTVSAGDKRFSQAFSNLGGQGTGGDVLVYDAPSGQCYRYDTLHAKFCTASGCVPMSLPDEFDVHEVYMSLNGEYLRIVFQQCFKGGCIKGYRPRIRTYWQIGTTNVVHCYTSAGNRELRRSSGGGLQPHLQLYGLAGHGEAQFQRSLILHRVESKPHADAGHRQSLFQQCR